MGIQGLLPLLREASRTVHLESLRGLTIGVDAYVWLHRAAYGCAADLALGKPTRRYVDYCVDQVKRLQSFGIVPFLVFDGGPLPSKKGTEVERRAKREEARNKGFEHWHAGQKDKAFEYFASSVDVSPAMAFEVIKALRRMNVQYIVAPYEADAQLAYLEKTGVIDAILTEDSDLLVFGCKRVLYKLDKDSVVQEITRTRFCDVRAEIVLGGKFTDDKFRWMCIMSGCDYLPSIPNLGLKKAYKLLVRCSTVAMALRTGSFSYKFTVPKDYLDEFQRAENTFLYQRVFDPKSQKLVPLNPPPPGFDLDAAHYLGPHLHEEIARAIATGDLDPVHRVVLGTVSDVVREQLAALQPAAVVGGSASSQPPQGTVLVLGSEDDEPAAESATRPTKPVDSAAMIAATESRVLKQITSQTVVDSRTRSPFFAPRPVDQNKIPSNGPFARAAVEKPKRVITLKRLNDENLVSDLALPATKVEQPSAPSATSTKELKDIAEEEEPESAAAVADDTESRDDGSSSQPKAATQSSQINPVENASKAVFQGMLNKYRASGPTVPLPAPPARAGPPRAGLNLQSFAKSFPAYDFLYQPGSQRSQSPMEPSSEGPAFAEPAWNSQPAGSSSSSQSAITKRKRQSLPLPKSSSQPVRTKRVSLSNQTQLTSGWFAGWQPPSAGSAQPEDSA